MQNFIIVLEQFYCDYNLDIDMEIGKCLLDVYFNMLLEEYQV